MEVDWQQESIDAYGREAHRALQRFIEGEREDAFFLRALELVRTYLHAPRFSIDPRPVDLDIVRLAQAIQAHLFDRGFWRQMTSLWPQVVALAEQLPIPMLHAELVKQLAMVKDRQGDGEETDLLYRQLLHSPHLSQLPVEIQADLLQQAGTKLVWQGKLVHARALLKQVLILAQEHPTPQNHRNQVDCYGVRASLEMAPMWENEAYALNQLGNVAMFQGKFRQAERLYMACWETLNQHDEAENLECVAHQALGRLWLHWRRTAEAIPILEKGIAIRRRRQEWEGVAINLIYLAAALIQRKQLGQAEALLMEALPVVRTIGNRRDTGLCHLYFGELELLQGHRSAAFEQWQQALDHLQTVHTPLVEQRVFLYYRPWLLAVDQVAIFRKVARQLYRTLRQQELRPVDEMRLMIQLGLKQTLT